LLNDVSQLFKEVKVVKPKSSRSESKEVYLLAMYRRKDKL
jgi:23S rRNA U2552 (ribose-2'-O)-methylase RlmE/FtsJ